MSKHAKNIFQILNMNFSSHIHKYKFLRHSLLLQMSDLSRIAAEFPDLYIKASQITKYTKV